MSDLIDMKIANALLRAQSNCDCNWDKPVDVINQMPQTISLWGDTYDKSQYWDQWHWIVVDWNQGHFQILNLPGCNYWIIFLNGKVGCKYTLVVNVVGNEDPNGNLCQGQYIDLFGNISGYNCDKADSCNVLWPYNDGSIEMNGTTFLGFALLQSASNSGVYLDASKTNIFNSNIGTITTPTDNYSYYVISKVGGFE